MVKHIGHFTKVKYPARLRHLLDVLETQAKSKIRFDMEVFGQHEGDHPPEEQNYCGTSACALGSAALDPKFNKMGLKGKWRRECNDSYVLDVFYKDEHEFDAAQSFFGITETAADYLFDPYTYRTKDGGVRARITRGDVMKRIRKILDTGNFAIPEDVSPW